MSRKRCISEPSAYGLKESGYIEAMRSHQRHFEIRPDYGFHCNALRNSAERLYDREEYEKALKKYNKLEDEFKEKESGCNIRLCETRICIADLCKKLRKHFDARSALDDVESRLMSFSTSTELSTEESVYFTDERDNRARRMCICMASILNPNNEIILNKRRDIARVPRLQGLHKAFLAVHEEYYQDHLEALRAGYEPTKDCCMDVIYLLRHLCRFKEASFKLTDLLENWQNSDSFIRDGKDYNKFRQTIAYERGNNYYEEGRYSEALVEYKSIRDSDNNQLDDVQTLNARRMIAKINFKNGHRKQALEDLEDVRDIQKRDQPENRAELIITLRDIAEIQQELGQYDEAEKTYYEMKRMSKSPDYPKRQLLDIDIKLTSILANKRPEEAVDRCQTMLLNFRIAHSPGRSLIGSVQNVLATAHCNLMDYSDAIKLYKEMIKTKISDLSAHHPDTLSIKHSLGRSYLASGYFTEALSTYAEVREYRYATFVPSHPDCLSIDYDIAGVHEAEGRLDEAFKIYCHLYETAVKVYTADHPNISKFESKMRSVAGEKNESQLIVATQNNDANSVMSYIRDQGENVNTRSKTGSTPLHIACEKGDVKIFRYLLSVGANYEIMNWESKTPYDVASDCVIKYLLEQLKNLFQTVKGNKDEIIIRYGDILNARDNRGRSLLHYASENAHVRIVRQLLDNKADIGRLTKTEEIPVLYTAAQTGNCEVLRIVLDHLKSKNPQEFGSIVNGTENAYGETPLHFSARSNLVSNVKLLLECGANRNIKNKLKELPVDVTRDTQIKSLLRVR